MVELPDFRSHSNFGPFSTQPLFDHLKSRLARISDPHCTWFLFLMGHLNSPRPSFEWKAKKHISFFLVLFTFLMQKMWKNLILTSVWSRQHPKVVSGFSLCHFRTMEYISDQQMFLAPSFPHPHFERPKYYFICSNAMFLCDSHSLNRSTWQNRITMLTKCTWSVPTLHKVIGFDNRNRELRIRKATQSNIVVQYLFF